MPFAAGVTARFVSGDNLCRNNVPTPTAINGDFYKIKLLPPFHTIEGKININFDVYRISHGGIKIRLEGYLELNPTVGRSSNFTVDIFERCPIEVLLESGDLVRYHKKLNFKFEIPSDRQYPTPFISNIGSLNYRLVALITRDSESGRWETFAKKLVHFKGFHNITPDIGPLEDMVDIKLLGLGDHKIPTIFTVPHGAVVMGREEILKATLELQGDIDRPANATLFFLRSINYGTNHIATCDTIWSNTQRIDQRNDVLFEWSFVVPHLSMASYSNELCPYYSVRYFLKYQLFLEEVDNGDENATRTGVNGIVEVKVGTERDSYETDGAHCSHDDRRGTGRRRSLISMMSTLSLPPSYSHFRQRSGSAVSIETQDPPRYEDI